MVVDRHLNKRLKGYGKQGHASAKQQHDADRGVKAFDKGKAGDKERHKQQHEKHVPLEDARFLGL